jgi:deoxyadenosine kinase
MNSNNFIGISGIIGAGKTTLSTALSKIMGLPVYYEPVIDNIYLDDFYRDMSRYAYPLQIYLLNKRFAQHQQIIWNGKGGIQDRTIYEDSIFARILYEDGFMDKRDYDTYMELFNNMSNLMKRNTLIIHLDVTPEEALDRIKERGRECEAGISIEYLRKLHDGYNTFIDDISHVVPVIRVRYDRYRTAEDMAAIIYDRYKDMKNIVDVYYD